MQRTLELPFKGYDDFTCHDSVHGHLNATADAHGCVGTHLVY